MRQLPKLAAARPVGVIAASLLLVVGIFAVSGYDVGAIVAGTVDGSVGSAAAWTQTIRWAIPLLIIALGVGLAFQAGYFNIGAQGQMYVGAIGSLAVGLAWRDGPALVVVPCAFAVGIALGALWSLVPGLLRTRLGADEVVTSLMMNFIAVLLLEWVCTGPLKSRDGTGQAATTDPLPAGFRLSDGSGVSPTLLVLCALLVAGAVILTGRTRLGLEIRLVGRNPVMAQWMGIRASRVGLVVFALSGAAAGLAGAVEAYGPSGGLRVGFSPQVGFMAVIVALVAAFGPIRTLLAAVFFGALRAATIYLPIVSDLPQAGLDMLNGTVALWITVSAVPVLLKRRRARAAARAGDQSGEPARRDREVVSSRG
ncbi:ABC transporter permease [Actinomadura livida]|uniref:ABC transporter permease n=1 Tax=Actinomadura livida TaxID=79909 RepID=A0A7W7MV91_9ACTN|nr:MULTISPECIES: ABC transporter permease [Actinomadura]MBB4772313.1 simple sugar transport system permease protein [Actinomadura catellatispora]GGU28463.1 ABC transporter permease [Actinomadura livida]